MLIKFYSEESASFVMLDGVANQLLTIMGHGSSTEGSVSGEALSSALDYLTLATTNNKDESVSGNPDEPEEVTLSARAAPLIAMLRRASDADGYVMWRPN
ncbi:DUF1840 family protein [Marinomonas sp. TI.3.20]|uniref:DUF1840 family protein n=1 Tax=Marinomonas sp. TI.3.20 TaxID=3121296 RepID=UPI00311FF83A